MSDDADLAGPFEQRQRDEAIARQAQKSATHETAFEVEGTRVCLNCFEPIQKRRLKANPNAVRCTDCQEMKERRDARLA